MRLSLTHTIQGFGVFLLSVMGQLVGSQEAPLILLPPDSPNSLRFGRSVAGVRDITGDGVDDLAIAGLKRSTLADATGVVYLFDGSTFQYLRKLESPPACCKTHLEVDGLEDVNGDGFGDILVGSSHADPGWHPEEFGRAFAFDGVSGEVIHEFMSPYAGTDLSKRGWFGRRVAGLSDLNCRPQRNRRVFESRRKTHDAGQAIYDGSSGTLLFELI
jgi:hypothetical protein